METHVPERAERWRLFAWLAFVLALTGLSYASRLADGDPPEDLAYRYSSSIGALVQYGLMLGILLLMARGLPLRQAFALRQPASWGRAAGFMAAALVGIWVASAVFAQFLDANEEQGFVPDDWDSSRVGAFAAFFVSVAVVAPIVEELTYRGLGFFLLAPYGTVTAVLATAALFGLAHGLLVALPILVIFGLGVGWLRAKTDSVYPSMILHGIFNGVALIVSVAVLD